VARFALERTSKSDGDYAVTNNETHIMDLLLSPAHAPILASALYIGGGGVGLVLLIVILVLVFRG
jgi:hypothetical protein